MTPGRAVRGLVTDGAAAVVIRRGGSSPWELPGGLLDADESAVDGWRRLVQQQTGLVVDVSGHEISATGVDVLSGRPVVGQLRPAADLMVRWVSTSQLSAVLPPATCALLRHIRCEAPIPAAADG